MEDSLKCPVCLDFADNAQTTHCCANVFCFDCISLVSSCPCCRRSPLKFSSNPAISRLIGQLKTSCADCRAVVQRSNLESHASLCPNRKAHCPVESCNVKESLKDVLKHAIVDHADKISSVSESQVMEGLKVILGLRPLPRLNQPITDREVDNTDPIAIVLSPGPMGVTVERRHGSNGKYYCGGPTSMMFTDGQCGPTNGDNCVQCQELDIKSRRLPKGFLVNGDGAICRRGSGGVFYCGRFKEELVHDDCDGWCGPTNGPNCGFCKLMEVNVLREYAHLV